MKQPLSGPSLADDISLGHTLCEEVREIYHHDWNGSKQGCAIGSAAFARGVTREDTGGDWTGWITKTYPIARVPRSILPTWSPHHLRSKKIDQTLARSISYRHRYRAVSRLEIAYEIKKLEEWAEQQGLIHIIREPVESTPNLPDVDSSATQDADVQQPVSREVIP